MMEFVYKNENPSSLNDDRNYPVKKEDWKVFGIPNNFNKFISP